MGPVYLLRREIGSFHEDLALLEFQLEQIERMLVELRGEAERRLWTDFAQHMREEINWRRRRPTRRSKAAATGQSESRDRKATVARPA